MNIGDTLTKSNYTEGAIWCNKNNAHIEVSNGAYVIVANTTAEQTTAEKLASLESEFSSGQQEYITSLGVATLNGDADLITEIKEEYAEYVTEYAAAKAELEA